MKSQRQKIYLFLLKFKENEHCATKVNLQMIICVFTQKLWNSEKQKVQPNVLFYIRKRNYLWNSECFSLCFINWFFINLNESERNCLHFILSWEKNWSNLNNSDIIILSVISFKKSNNWKHTNDTLSLFIILRMNKV